jgi:hypothetical protein
MSFILQFLIVSRAWQLFWPSKKESFDWFWERLVLGENLKAGGGDLLFYLVETGKS